HRGERLEVLVLHEQDELIVRKRLGHLSVRYYRIPYGDIWLRDTAPIFAVENGRSLVSCIFEFNGWGQKYVLDHDTEVSARIANVVDAPSAKFPWVLEGGALDVDGSGNCLTTRQCLLNRNRNPKRSPADIEQGLRQAFGITKVVWLNRGLVNDHTDGHV